MHVGLDRLPDLPQLKRIRSARLGVLAHPASVDRELTHIAAVLEELGVRPRLFFGPEHGYGGEAQDMAAVRSDVDGRLGARIVGLTWNERNAFASGMKQDGREGLSPLGRALVKEGDRLGVQPPS